jgi:hypothetical protein
MVDVVTTPVSELGGDGTATLTVEGGTPAYAIVWSTGITDVYELTALEAGEYLVTVTDANLCAEDMEFTIGVAMGVNGTTVSMPSIHPTLAVNELFLVNCPVARVQYRIFDTMGQLHLEHRDHDTNGPINVQRLAAGPYILKVYLGSVAYSMPFVRSNQ